MNRNTLKVAALLFGSGACALVYQVAWLREFKLIFGASTAASAAVLAVFIGGLGLGSKLLGPRADRQARPLRFYARLEVAIALGAALTPAFLAVAHAAYVGLGGTVALGAVFGTLLRLVLSALVLVWPTLLMGGTLPAAARAVASESDVRRRAVALLYGANTLGAVAGCFAATFFLLEALGTRQTLWSAAVVNLLVAAAAYRLGGAQASPAAAAQPVAEQPGVVEAAAVPTVFPLAASALVGCAFFLMEMVWYRMLAPLLGGSVFTFGLILAFALLGIGLGGALYSAFGERRPATLRGFATTCLLEAAAMILPFALGDRIALVALLLRSVGNLGFWGYVLGWSAVTAVVVLPAALVAGYQFPLLIALLGRGRDDVGKHVGLAYAWNTVGAIVGSLAGGFGLLPALGATGCWRLVAISLTVLGLGTVLLSLRREAGVARLAWPLVVGGAVAVMLVATGPTAAWRHSGIGVGRAAPAGFASRNAVTEWLHAERRSLVWEHDGVESAVALKRQLGVYFVINGKNDGHATLDAPTAVGSGLLGGFVHPAPRNALVVGFGTGSTAGWMAAIPEMERVDVFELEPATVRVARDVAPVSRDALSNPKIHLAFGDAREGLLTSRRTYDVILSEPSNPYRAGIASLFTQEFYRAVERRLAPGGIFVQWIQSYEIEASSIRSVYSTLQTVFPVVESWRTHRDLLLLASREPIPYDVSALRARLARSPYSEGFLAAWGVSDLEGVLGHFVATPEVARAIASGPGAGPNTDDRNALEFGFARSVGRAGLFDLKEIRDAARRMGQDHPALSGSPGDVDWARVVEERVRLHGGGPAADELGLDGELRARAWAYTRWQQGHLDDALLAWRTQRRAPKDSRELALVGEGLADVGDEAASDTIEALRRYSGPEADALLGRLRFRQGLLAEAATALVAAYEAHRRDPWPDYAVMNRSFGIAIAAGKGDTRLAPALYDALASPFAAMALDSERQRAALELSAVLPDPQSCVKALRPFEPHVPWTEGFLVSRLQCYAQAKSPMARSAVDDLQAFRSQSPSPLLPSPTQ